MSKFKLIPNSTCYYNYKFDLFSLLEVKRAVRGVSRGESLEKLVEKVTTIVFFLSKINNFFVT